MKKGVIEHEGEVCEISPKGMKVKVISKSACAACHAKGLCGSSDTKEKFIDIKRENFIAEDKDSFKIGDKVMVNMEESLGMRAVWIVYAVPTVILVTILLYLQSLNVQELVVGIIAIGAIALYFFLLYIFRGKLGRRFRFTVYKIDNN